MSRTEKECLCADMEMSIAEAEHIIERFIQEYDLDKEDVSELDIMVFAANRHSIWLEMEMLADYIKSIRAGYDSIREAVGV